MRQDVVEVLKTSRMDLVRSLIGLQSYAVHRWRLAAATVLGAVRFIWNGRRRRRRLQEEEDYNKATVRGREREREGERERGRERGREREGGREREREIMMLSSFSLTIERRGLSPLLLPVLIMSPRGTVTPGGQYIVCVLSSFL